MAKNVLINHPDGSGGWHEIHPVTKSTNVFDADGKSVEQKFTDHFSEVATTTKSGHMTATDKKKLDGVEAGANKYTHPTTHPASIITEDATHRFVTDAEKTNWTGKETTAGAQQKVDALGGPGNTKTVKQLDEVLATHSADMASQELGKGASLVGVHDASNLFTATTVEGALKEAITQANAAFTSASNGKNAIKNAITGTDPKVVVPLNPTFAQLATAIGTIKTGILSEIKPGTSIIASNTTIVSVSASADFVDRKVFRAVEDGTYRVSMNLYIQGSSAYWWNTRIYVNDVPRGLTRQLNYYADVTYTEDVILKKGDLMQIKTQTESGLTMQIRNVSVGIAIPSLITAL